MSEENLNNFKPDNDVSEIENTSPEPETGETANMSSAFDHSSKTYEDVYSSSSDYTQPAENSFTNPYADRTANASAPHSGTGQYNSQGSVNYGTPYTGSTNGSGAGSYSSQPSGTQGNPYGDGYYHRSFADDTSGNNINYTAPRYSQPVQNIPQASSKPPKRKQKKSGGISKGGIALLLIVCLLISAGAGFGGSMLANSINKSKYEGTSADTMVIHKVDTENVQAGTENLVDKTTAEISNEVADSVVEVTTEIMQTNSFYGQYIAMGAGSGVIISDDGYIITNNHVIEGASSITVTTRDGTSYEAKLIGTDTELDIAVLKVDAKGLHPAVFGDSSKLEVGSKSVIIGNPLGTLGGSVTEGIVSALDRSIVIDGKTMHLIQTDASINPGNSGGGMFNGQGELTGIVVAKSSSSSTTGTIDNIGFVIPINNVLDILGDLKDYGYVRGRADTGMSFIDLSNQMYAWYYYGNSSAGVYISSVTQGSNAAKAGFKAGDRVISVDGQTISAASEIDTIISGKSAGDKVTFELERGGSKGSLELELQEYVPTQNQQLSGGSQNKNPFGGLW